MEETLSNNTSESKNAMSHSDSYEEKCVSKEDDLKKSIPYLHAQNEEAEERNTYGTLDDDLEDDAKSYGYQNWDADDEYGDEIESRVGLDYSNPNDSGKYFAAPYSQDPNLQYPAAEMVFRPPAASSAQYNYNYPHSSAHSHRQKYTPSYNTSTTTQPSTSAQALGFAASPNFHPNMWYPNAPYGSGSFYPQYGQNRFPHYGAGYPHDQMADMHQLSNSGREARNRAEKNRRDKLNGSIQELSTMVPHVAESPRRVDKTAVLRFAAHGLRLQYAFRNTINASRPELTDTLMRLMDSFFLTVTCHGQILLISTSIEQHLGHCQADLYGQNILHITHPEDHEMIKRQLIPSDLETLFDIQPDDNSDEPIQRTQEEEDYIDQKLLEDKRSFTVRFARAGPRSEPTTYEVCKVEGCFRRSDAAPRGSKTSTSPAGLQLIRRTQRRDEAIPLTTISGNDIALVAVARIVRPAKIDNTIIETNLEYRTRHLIDGRIIDCDQRIGIVAGYMTDEVRNLSPFTFMHQDDVRWVIVALRQMYDCNSSYGESTYRLLTRNGYFIYLQSKGYLEIDKETNTVHSFVCVNTLLDEEEGKRRVHEMKKKFSVIINNQIPSSTPSTENVPASQNPQQLVKAVLCLIQNLQKTSSDDEEGNGPTSHFDSALQYKPDSSLPSRSMSSSSMSLTKTPPLALVPPEVSSVETSISKSVSVVNDTSAKYLRGNQLLSPRCSKSPLADVDEESIDDSTETFSCSCQYQNNGSECEVCEKSKNRISSLKRTLSCTESEDLKLPKRRLKSTEIHQVIFSSLDQLGRSLQKQQNAAIELRDQTNKFEVPNSKNRIKEIMDECQKQNEMYVNITSEIQNQAIDAITTKTADPQITDDLHPT